MTHLSSHIVCDYALYLRGFLSDAVNFSDVIIGGHGVVVEKDETKLGKRKYHRSHCIEGIWDLSGIEGTSEKKCFVVEIEDESMHPIFRL